MRVDFHCHIFHNKNAFQAFKLYNQKFSGYGFYKRVLKMLEGINTINTDDIIRKTLYHIERVKIDKAVMLPVSEKENVAVSEWAQNAPDIIIPFFNPPERLDDSKGIKDIIEKAILEDNYKGFKIMVSFRKKKLEKKGL